MAEETHREVIQSNKVYLVEHLDLINTVVLDRLVEMGVLSQEQLMSVKERSTNNLQMASSLLDQLYRKTETDWQNFLVALDESGLGSLKKQIQRFQAVAHLGPSLDRLQKKMANKIMMLYSEIALWTLHSDLCKVPMEDLYVQLVRVKDEERLRAEGRLKGYKDIFEKARDGSTIYLSGEPGVGKSTFTQHLCVEWAKLHDKGGELKVDDPFEKFHFVLPIFLRDIKQGGKICDVFSEEFQLRQSEAEELYNFIDTTEEPILVIADGLDEYTKSTSEEITKLLGRKILPHVTLFITSRFCPESFFVEGKFRPDIEVALRGFSEAGVEEYLSKYFNNQKSEIYALLKKIKESEELDHLSHYPAILLMMATLWQEYQRLPRTITGFYEEFVAYVFARMEKKKIQNLEDRAKSTEDLLKKYDTHITAFGCLATGNVKTYTLELKFTKEDILKHISSDDIDIGFLIQKQTFSRKIFYLFFHKTMQEYFLAFYLVHSDKPTQQKLLLRFFNSRQAFRESGMIRRFVAGLGDAALQAKIYTLIDGEEEEAAEMHTNLQLDYLAEQQATFPLPQVVKLHIDHRYTGSHYARYLSKEGGELRKIWLTSSYVRHWRMLQHLQAPKLICLHLWRSRTMSTCSVYPKYISETLNTTLTKFLLTTLTVGELYDLNESYAVVKAVVHIETLQEFASYKTLMRDHRINMLKTWLPKSHLTSLTMSDCDLTSSDVLGVIDAAPETLTNLDLSCNCREGGNDLVRVTERTSQVTKLKTLNLRKNKISDNVVTTIKQTLTETCQHLELIIYDQ